MLITIECTEFASVITQLQFFFEITTHTPKKRWNRTNLAVQKDWAGVGSRHRKDLNTVTDSKFLCLYVWRFPDPAPLFPLCQSLNECLFCTLKVT